MNRSTSTPAYALMVLISACYFSVLEPVLFGQTVSNPEITVKTSVRLVQFGVSVIGNTNRRAVDDLSEQDFVVYDNSQQKKITSFLRGANKPPVTLMFLIEDSQSQVKAVNGLVESFPVALKSLPAADRVGIVGVYPGHKIVLEPTQPPSFPGIFIPRTVIAPSSKRLASPSTISN